MITKLVQLNNNMQNSFNELVKILLEYFDSQYDNRGNPRTAMGTMGVDALKSATGWAAKGVDVLGKTAMFAAGVTPPKVGLSNITKNVFKYFSDINRQKRLYQIYASSYNANAEIKCISEAVNTYFKAIVNFQLLLKKWGVDSLKEHTKGDVIYAQNKFLDENIIPNANWLYNTYTPTTPPAPLPPFDIKKYTLRAFLDHVDEHNKTAVPADSMSVFSLINLSDGLIRESRIKDTNIELLSFFNLVQSLFLTIPGGKLKGSTTRRYR